MCFVPLEGKEWLIMGYGGIATSTSKQNPSDFYLVEKPYSIQDIDFQCTDGSQQLFRAQKAEIEVFING